MVYHQVISVAELMISVFIMNPIGSKMEIWTHNGSGPLPQGTKIVKRYYGNRLSIVPAMYCVRKTDMVLGGCRESDGSACCSKAHGYSQNICERISSW